MIHYTKLLFHMLLDRGIGVYAFYIAYLNLTNHMGLLVFKLVYVISLVPFLLIHVTILSIVIPIVTNIIEQVFSSHQG